MKWRNRTAQGFSQAEALGQADQKNRPESGGRKCVSAACFRTQSFRTRQTHDLEMKFGERLTPDSIGTPFSLEPRAKASGLLCFAISWRVPGVFGVVWQTERLNLLLPTAQEVPHNADRCEAVPNMGRASAGHSRCQVAFGSVGPRW